jgi:sec-independent protein translocase protein TatB
MNIFSNVGITELVVILLLALLVVGPERLPELGRSLAKTLRDLRKAYENLTQDLGPELRSIQDTTRELRESVESVRSIPQDAVESVIKAADLDDTIAELKEVTGSLEEVRQTASTAAKMVKEPVSATVQAARSTLLPKEPADEEDREKPEARDEDGGQEATATIAPEEATDE